MATYRHAHVEDGDEVPYGLWYSALNRSKAGARGQQILRDMEQALLAIPDHRLCRGQIVNWAGDCCLIGAYAAYRLTILTDLTWDEAILRLLVDGEDYEGSLNMTAEFGRDLGLPWTMAWELAGENDRNGLQTPEERWQEMLDLVRVWITEGERDAHDRRARRQNRQGISSAPAPP